MTDMTKTTPEQNKATVLEAFDTLFNKRDYAGAERFWSDHYIQHSAHIAPGRAGLFDLIRTLPETLRYENQLIVAEGDYVIAHGRFSGNGHPAAWIAADVVRRAADVRRPLPHVIPRSLTATTDTALFAKDKGNAARSRRRSQARDPDL